MQNDYEILLALFESALGAALPDGKFDGRLPPKPKGTNHRAWGGQGFGPHGGRLRGGLDPRRRSLRGPCGDALRACGADPRIQIVEAAHPVPDEAGLEAARRILALAHEAGPDDLVVCLMSGGASALLSLPAEGVTLADKQALNRALLKSGAPIGEMNLVRKSLSAIKGGRLAAAVGDAQLVTYLISDVPGDDPASIGSGPTIPERIDPEVALGILRRYGIDVPEAILQVIRSNSVTEPVNGGAVHMLATPKMALDCAAAKARELGFNALVLGDALEGEAREVGRVMAGIAHSAMMHGEPAQAPCVLLSGGETTVTVRGGGRGGRNAEFLLSLALSLKGRGRISAIACDTDGIDGSEDNAGAWFDGTLFESARAKGIDLAAHLAGKRCLHGVCTARQARRHGADADERQ